MVISIIASVVLLVLILFALKAGKRMPGLGPILAFDVTYVFRLLCGHYSDNGHFLARPLPAWATAILGLAFLVVNALVVLRLLVMLKGYLSILRPIFAPKWWRSAFNIVGWFLLGLAATVPFDWFGPAGTGFLIILAGLIGAGLLRTGIKKTQWDKIVGGAVFLLVVIISLFNLSSSFWTEDFPHDIKHKTYQVLQIDEHNGSSTASTKKCTGCGASPSPSPQAHPVSPVSFIPNVVQNAKRQVLSVNIIEACQSLDACTANVAQAAFLAASEANHSHAVTTVTPYVNGKALGNVIRRTPNSKTDLQLGAKAGYPCLRSLTVVGHFDTTSTGHELVCVG